MEPDRFLELIPPIFDDESDAMGYLPGSAAIPLNKTRWMIGIMNPSAKEKKIHFSQANSYFHLSFMSSGFSEALWAEIKNIQYPRFFFDVYDKKKGGELIAQFTMDGDIKENKGRLIVIFPAPVTVWSE